ncbi:MAG: TolC family protein, partial [Proteobacteria bacterium]|nr:TolC family protein [Pseudomonadota bacterium]
MQVRTSVLGLAFIAAAANTAAASSGDAHEDVAPAVDELVAIALAQAPEIPVYEARSRASQEREDAADALPDPTLGLTAQGMGLTPPGPASSIVVDVSQELPFPGKRAARQAAAEAETNVRTAETGDVKRRIAARVRVLYARIYSLDRERSKRISTRDLLGLLSRTLTTRYSTGQVDRSGLLRIRLESARIDERMIGIDAERAELVASLNRLLDRTGDTPLGRVPALPRVAIPDVSLDKSALEASSELAVLRAEAAAAEKRVDETRLEEKPDFSVGLGGGVDGMAEPVVMLRFGVG